MAEQEPKIKFYYAHPVCYYDTVIEAYVVGRMKGCDLEVVNPNTPEHQEGYAREGMDYFLKICEECSGCVFQSFTDFTLGAGVAKEVESFLNRDLPVYHIMYGQFITVNDLDNYKVLSIEETRNKDREIKGFIQQLKREGFYLTLADNPAIPEGRIGLKS